jgi:PAS domain S-box-containing protein
METKNKAVILIVDDKPANILALESLLADKDRTILHALNGKEALQTLLNKEIDLIILDVQMPEMDGFEVANIIKSNKRTKDIPIIFASAERKDHEFMLKGYEEGAIDYLSKPLNPGIAKAKVSVFLKIQLQKKELIEKNESLQKSALLIENSADILGIIDASTLKIEELNNAFTELLGYSKEEACGTELGAYLDEEDADMIKRQSRSNKEKLSFETAVYCKDESIKWLHWKIVVKENKWYANASDITQQKAAGEEIQKLNRDLQANVLQLEANNKEIESFSYSISHDLRAPLRALNGYSSMLEEDYGKTLDSEARRMLSSIAFNAQKMGRLIDDLLTFSRMGKKEIQKTQVNMSEMVKGILAEISRSKEHKAAVLIHELPEAMGDQALLTQVWINLLSNAIKYSANREKPCVEIGSEISNQHITYFVKDNGAGFNMKYADKLFGVFQRLHSDKEFEGTGVGLAIVQRIIARHGGRVWAQAEEGAGATFYFTLPHTQDKN